MYLYKKRVLNEQNYKKEIIKHVLLFYMLCLYQITAIRIGLGLSIESITSRDYRVNFVPIAALWRWVLKGRWWLLTYHVIGNCIWFVPLGVLVPALFHKQRKLWRITLLGAGISLSIEILQFIICTGVTDIDDVIFNTLGTVIGYCIWKLCDSIRGSLEMHKTI